MDMSQSSSQQQHQHQHQQQSCYQHQPTTPSKVIQQLKLIYQQVLQKQRHQLSQLLNLQKLLNHIHSTVPITRDDIAKIQKLNQTNRLKQQQKKMIMNKGFNLERIGQKIQQIIEQTPDEVIVAVEEDVVEQKIQKQQTAHQTNSNKTQSKKKITIIPSSLINSTRKQTKPQPIIQQKKKPPIPTGNRNTNDIISRGSTTKYIPPRNKNEVTGKVTQTKIMTQQKVFKPENNTNINQQKGSNINKPPATSSSSIGSTATTINKSSTITTNTKTTNTINATTRSSVVDKNLNKQSIPSSTLQDANSISEYKNLRMMNNKEIRLKQFNKPIQQLYQQSLNNNKTNKNNNNNNNNKQKKYNFKQLIQKYTQQQMGHKNLQQKRRQQYIKKLNNFALSINTNINCNEITNSINKRLWSGYPSIYQFNQLLQKLQQDIQRLQYQDREDLRSDPRMVYKVQCMGRLVQKEVGEIMASTEIEVPEKIQVTFSTPINSNSNNNKKAITKQQQHQQQQATTTQITLQPFYEQLSQLIKQTHQNESLSTKDLSLLRVISQIVLYDGRRSPLIVRTNQLQQWRQSYSQVQERGDSQYYQ